MVVRVVPVVVEFDDDDPLDPGMYRGSSPAATVDLIDQDFFAGEMPAATRTALTSYAGTAALSDAKLRETDRPRARAPIPFSGTDRETHVKRDAYR